MCAEQSRPGLLKRFLSSLGPGIITGAADDDPSGIATYSIAGAQHGLALLWTALILWPLMAFVQMMCARIGMVTGRGLAGALHRKFPRPLIMGSAIALFVANSINVGADLSGMADAAEMLTRINSHVFVILFGIGISLATIFFRYHQIAAILKWLALVLFAYVITGFIIRPDWRIVAHATFIPSWPKNHDEWSTLVAILGTSISPYLFFWQASQEVEEDKAKGRRMLYQRFHANRREIITRKVDVDLGTFFSNLVMFFIILTTALTLHEHGLTNIQNTKDAALALTPLAGKFAATLFTLGIVGVGLLAIPTLTGSAAYALAETFGWREGLDRRYTGARHFYLVIIVSTGVGIAMDLLRVNPVRALYWTAIINGLLAPFLLLGIIFAAFDSTLMKGQPSSRASVAVVSFATLLMFGAAIGMFIF
ncbi:MAG TPA: Nramp family divalent metal transporter [Candidatus Udaeobacter sp.]|jgi:NRAMP (natural resistance-associated macrophage protein)-like metal ion transporter|nr:Nramp family divalent metal transporter [Candidatus Udaeobacter sp.]